MNKVILIRFSEIHLKGGNKKYFIKLLQNNIKQALKSFECKIENIQNRLLVRDYLEEDEIISALKAVFGIHSISKAVEVDNDVETIKNYVANLKIEGTFKCDVNIIRLICLHSEYGAVHVIYDRKAHQGTQRKVL